MKRLSVTIKNPLRLLLVAFVAPAIAFGQEQDTNGVLIKPIPEKLVVLTFDDGPASHATVVAPILKEFGIGGSFYVCDFDSFHTRKDWYLTYRQMKAMSAARLEIGNHTRGHAGGASIGPFLDMEDQLIANGVPKPTTIAWPVYQVNTAIYPDLAKSGYAFGRGGHSRPYRPTVDNPFDIPSMYCSTVEEFVKCVRRATGGRIVVMTFHGVPDIEHPAVGTDPSAFREMMQYLKDNNYHCVALRDLAQYIDPAKAAQLPSTRPNYREPEPVPLLTEIKPYVPAPKNIPVKAAPQNPTASSANEMLKLEFPSPSGVVISGSSIAAYVPTGTDVSKLAPLFTLSPGASATPPSGTARDFSAPQVYTVTAQDGSSRNYTVTIFTSDQQSVFTWSDSAAGNWSDAAKWTGSVAGNVAPGAGGRKDYVFHFSKSGSISVTNNADDEFLLNQLNFSGPTVKVTGKSFAFSANGSLLPRLSQTAQGSVAISNPVTLNADLTVSSIRNSEVSLGGAISGSGSLIKDGEGRLRINHKKNTFTGGAVIRMGSLLMDVANEGLGSGPITLHAGASLNLEHVDGKNALTLNGGTINAGNGFGDSWSGAITLNGNVDITSYADFVLSSAITGQGGLTHIGGIGAFGPSNSGTVTLAGANAYAGPTVVRRGTLRVLKAESLYGAAPAGWTADKIIVHPAATLVLSVGGRDGFTGEQLDLLLKNLTASVNENGLMNLSIVCLDSPQTADTAMVSSNLADSKGPGGGAYHLKKRGPGTITLSGANTYTGRTSIEGGTLSVASINSVSTRMPSSNLGAPTNVEQGEIFIGSGDGDATLRYTGKGETTDRVLNLAGKKSTVTLNHSGTGLLKFTSPFVISGYGASKVLALTGSTTGTGELATTITDPHDRAGIATTSITKAGSGTWILSGENSFTGPITVTGGTLTIANRKRLAPEAVAISNGAVLELRFLGGMSVRRLSIDGQSLPPGTYSSASNPANIKGSGALIVKE